jgi:hypothetical protein
LTRTSHTLREAATGKVLLALAERKPREEAWDRPRPVFSPDGRMLATVNSLRPNPDEEGKLADYRICVWDLATGREILSLPTGAIWALAFSPDSRTLAAAGGFRDPYFREKDGDTSVRLWDLATGNELLRLHENNSSVTSLAFAPDGQSLAGGMRDTTVLVWDLTPGLRRLRLPAKDLGVGDFDRLWADLAGDDTAKARVAVGSLVAAADQAVPLLKDRLRPAAAVPAERLRKLLADLDSEAFAVREAARKELHDLGDLAEQALRKALEGNPSLETRKRIEALLDVSPLPARSPEVLRRLRAIQALEQIGTPAARQLLQHLAEGAPSARETREARAALQRLGSRTAGP